MSTAPSMVVEGVEVPERLIAQEIGNHPAPSAEAARLAAARALAVRALLLDRARKAALEAEPEIDPEGREETADEALMRALLDRELQIAEPTDEECRRIYDSRPDGFKTPTLTQASHILLCPAEDAPAAWAAALASASEVISQLTLDPSAFARLASSVSQCPSSGVGGSLGQLSPGDLAPEVETALAALAPGETSVTPVRSRFGWHVLRLDRRIEGRRLPFDSVHDRIADHLRQRAWAAAAARYVAELAAQARASGVALKLDEEGDVSATDLSFGDLLSDTAGVAARVEAWLDVVDPEMAALARSAADRAGQPVADHIRGLLATFVGKADDQAWTNLISTAQGAADPALACVQSILRKQLTPAARTFTLIQRR